VPTGLGLQTSRRRQVVCDDCICDQNDAQDDGHREYSTLSSHKQASQQNHRAGCKDEQDPRPLGDNDAAVTTAWSTWIWTQDGWWWMNARLVHQDRAKPSDDPDEHKRFCHVCEPLNWRRPAGQGA